MRIPYPYLRQLLARGVAVWLLALLAAFLVIAVMSAMVRDKAVLNDISVHPAATVVVAAALMLVDLHRRKELMLLNNLGVPTSHAVLIGSAPALLSEAMRLVLA